MLLFPILQNLLLCIRYAIPVVILVGIVITLLLVFYPRSNQTSANDDDVDQLFIGRTILLLVLMIFVIVGCVLVLVFHWAEPIRAGPLRKPSHLNR